MGRSARWGGGEGRGAYAETGTGSRGTNSREHGLGEDGKGERK